MKSEIKFHYKGKVKRMLVERINIYNESKVYHVTIEGFSFNVQSDIMPCHICDKGVFIEKEFFECICKAISKMVNKSPNE